MCFASSDWQTRRWPHLPLLLFLYPFNHAKELELRLSLIMQIRNPVRIAFYFAVCATFTATVSLSCLIVGSSVVGLLLQFIHRWLVGVLHPPPLLQLLNKEVRRCWLFRLSARFESQLKDSVTLRRGLLKQNNTVLDCSQQHKKGEKTNKQVQMSIKLAA